MKDLRPPRFSLAAGVFAVLLSLHAHAEDEAAPRGAFLSPQVVRDLYYGDVLFHFYQDDYFGSLTRLGASQVLGRLTQQRDEAELLQGALYLSLGQHAEAGRIFRSLLNDNVADTVRNRAWFYLAKVWYQRSYLAEAEQALGSIKGALPDPLEGERHLLLAQVLMHQERYDEAVRVLESWHSADESGSYARFNLGVALVRQDRLDAAGRQQVAQTEEHRDALQGRHEAQRHRQRPGALDPFGEFFEVHFSFLPTNGWWRWELGNALSFEHHDMTGLD